MGDIKKIRKKFQKPSHPWQKERITVENALVKEYGLKNKSEIWKHASTLAKFKDVAKETISSTTKQSQKVAQDLVTKLRSLKLLTETSMLNDVLTLTEKDIMERRLQTVVCRQGLGSSMNQARQLIVHGHIKVNSRKISSPSYLVRVSEEDKITFADNSSMFAPDHSERVKIAARPAVTMKTDEERKDALKDYRKDDRKGGRRRPPMRRRESSHQKDAPKAH
jgi:small subunit ribosomal protein S4